MKCIVHYPNQGKYTKLKSFSDVNKTKIKKAKKVRENLGGKNHHLLQLKACLKFSMTIFMVFIVKHVTRSN